MPDLDYYLKLIPSQHSDKPVFVATVKLRIEFYVRMQAFLQSMTAAFDLDGSVGVQLDQNGEWIGRTRFINLPLDGVYFSWGIEGIGWDQGMWKGVYDPDTGVERLPDDVYRQLLKAKVAANEWDGTIPGAYSVWEMAFDGTGSVVFIEDHQDMSMTIAIAGNPPDAVMRALLTQGYLPLKPEGVRIKDYITPLRSGPIFAWGCENEVLNGWGIGRWPVSITEHNFAIEYPEEYPPTAYLRNENQDIVVQDYVIPGTPDSIFASDAAGNIFVKDRPAAGATSDFVKEASGDVIVSDLD